MKQGADFLSCFELEILIEGYNTLTDSATFKFIHVKFYKALFFVLVIFQNICATCWAQMSTVDFLCGKTTSGESSQGVIYLKHILK